MEKTIPKHLMPFVAHQYYHCYSSIDHAVWRYVMRQNHHFLEDIAHEAFTSGLKSSGIGIESIPRVSEMNEKLAKIDWGAVIVDGLIPGTAFFDFQAHGILPVATEIRQKTNIEYTPAPDIVHEAAGHAPILFDETYSEFVKLIGNIGANAFATSEEHEVFEATRNLSIVMENPFSTQEEITAAKQLLIEKQQAVKGLSEAEQISRIFWWTVEFGLIGSLDKPRIFGAGLLSSVGESKHCLSDAVQKRRFTIEDAKATSYDVTSMQTQLFVCESFEQLIDEVNKFGDTMAFRTGGTQALDKASNSGHVANIEFNSGIQLTGLFTEVIKNEQNEAIYLKSSSPSALSIKNSEITGHGVNTHQDGFGVPIGRLSHHNALEELSHEELKSLGITIGAYVDFQYVSGIQVTGTIVDMKFHQDKLVLLSLTECKVSHQDHLLFDPSWGQYDLIIASQVISARPGAADYVSYYGEPPLLTPDDKGKAEETPLESLYSEVRSLRENHIVEQDNWIKLTELTLRNYPEEWLLQLELLEMLEELSAENQVKQLLLDQLKVLTADDRYVRLIKNGLEVIYGKEDVRI